MTDPGWHDELVLVAKLSSVNNQIARYVLRLLDADAGRREQVGVTDECALGGRLVDLGFALQNRAVHRAASPDVDGGAIEAHDPRPAPLTPDGYLIHPGCAIR